MKKSKFTKLPALHHACMIDELRPHMEFVNINKDETWASDAHIIVAYKTADFFSPEFIEALPEHGISIHRKQWAELCKSGMVVCEIKPEYLSVLLTGESFVRFVNYKSDNKTPEYKSLFNRDRNSVMEIGLKTSLLKKISMATNGAGCIFHFTGENQSVRFESGENEDFKFRGIIMPFMINE